MRPPRKYTYTDALQRMRRYCAYQERCHKEVKDKLYTWGMDTEEIGRILVQLIEEKYLNEERYTKAIIGGKFRQKGWGRIKITQALKSKGIVSNLINYSLTEIDEKEYRIKLKELLIKKLNTLKAEHPLAKKHKMARYAIGKGYESELVWMIIEEILSDSE